MRVSFQSIPRSLYEFQQIAPVMLEKPETATALFLLALLVSKTDRKLAVDMMNVIKAEKPLTRREIIFLKNLLKQMPYLPSSYFCGASSANGYQPDEPLTVEVNEDITQFNLADMYRVYVKNEGSSQDRTVYLHKASDGLFYIWEHASLLLPVRKPESRE